jgi:hypothetical protein
MQGERLFESFYAPGMRELCQLNTKHLGSDIHDVIGSAVMSLFFNQLYPE